MKNLVAWCIVPYDAMHRNPHERAVMLKKLGFKKMAWDWRMEHLDKLPDEINAIAENDIELEGVWMPVGADSKEGLTPYHHKIFDAIKDAGITTTYWVAISDDYFSESTNKGKILEGVHALEVIYNRAKETESRIALYNHGGWAGEPENQVAILKELNEENTGIVYNFHHAHHQIDNFNKLLDIMMPYLYTVNINGMSRNGSQIMTVGDGDLETSMIKILLDSQFSGTIGILGHIREEDVELVLRRNLDGFQKILNELYDSHKANLNMKQ
jgi:hypothetical protein